MRLRLLVVALLLGRAHAGEPAEPWTLPPWFVTESRLSPETGSVRASAVVPADSWSGRAILTLGDAFRGVPGATMLESFGGFEPPRLSLRGSGIQSAPSSRGVALRWEGLPVGLADGSFNSALLDPRLATGLEVHRGFDGWREAPAAMGGALDLRRNGPAPAAAIGCEAGSYGRRQVLASSRLAGDRAIGDAAFSWAAQDGYRAWSNQERRAAVVSGRTSLAPEWNASAGLYQAHARYQVPGPLTLAAALAAPREISTDVARDRPERTAELIRVSAGLERTRAADELSLRVGWGRTDDDFRQLQANGISATTSDDVSAVADYTRRFEAVGHAHQLAFSGSVERGWRNTERWRNDAGQRGARFADDRMRPLTAVIRAEESVAMSHGVVAHFGLAQLSSRRSLSDQLGASGTQRSGDDVTLPAAGLRWRVSPRLVLVGGVCATAESPTYDDLTAVAGPYPNLRRTWQPLVAQRAVTTELAARGEGDRWGWDLAGYDAAWKNEILRLADARGAPRGAVNASPTRHRGIEASLRARLTDAPVRVSLAVSAAWSRIAFEGDAVQGNGRLAGLPPGVGAAELLAERPTGVFLAAGMDALAGRTFADHARRLSYGGRTLAHLRGGWRAGGWTLYVDVRNLFDHRAVASTAGVLDVARVPAATAIFLPAVGRSVTAGVAWRR